ncbi:MAG: translation initiation factor IF-3 [Dehalococcoidia bacterium]|nr:translation initiation factor IF-3 [Dehalococcoidia bacterium]
MVKELRINEWIRAKEVLLIGENGERVGVVPVRQAIQMARERSLDLVEVAPTAAPPVCRILDYGRYKFEQAKKEREARKTRKASLLREVRLRPRIDSHDLESKTRLIERLLGEGDKVKVTVFFRGREITRPELGKRILQQVLTDLKDKAVVDQPLVVEEKSLSLFFSPAKTIVKKATSEVTSAQAKDK